MYNRPSVYYKKFLYITLTPSLVSPSTTTVWWPPLITLQWSCSSIFTGGIPRRFRAHAHIQSAWQCHRMLRAMHCFVFIPMQKQMTSWYPCYTKGYNARSLCRISKQLGYCVLPTPIKFASWNAGGTLWHSWLRHCGTSWKVPGSIPDVTGIFYWHKPSGRTMALGLTQTLTEISTRNISWGVKAAGA